MTLLSAQPSRSSSSLGKRPAGRGSSGPSALKRNRDSATTVVSTALSKLAVRPDVIVISSDEEEEAELVVLQRRTAAAVPVSPSPPQSKPQIASGSRTSSRPAPSRSASTPSSRSTPKRPTPRSRAVTNTESPALPSSATSISPSSHFFPRRRSDRPLRSPSPDFLLVLPDKDEMARLLNPRAHARDIARRRRFVPASPQAAEVRDDSEDDSSDGSEEAMGEESGADTSAVEDSDDEGERIPLDCRDHLIIDGSEPVLAFDYESGQGGAWESFGSVLGEEVAAGAEGVMEIDGEEGAVEEMDRKPGGVQGFVLVFWDDGVEAEVESV